MCKALRFVCEGEKGAVLQSKEFNEDCMGTINKTVVSVFEGKYISKTITACATLETYGETPIFISVKITKEVIESVARTFWGSSSPGVTDYEALQGWIMKFWKYSTILRTSVEIFLIG